MLIKLNNWVFVQILACDAFFGPVVYNANSLLYCRFVLPGIRKLCFISWCLKVSAYFLSCVYYFKVLMEVVSATMFRYLSVCVCVYTHVL